MRRSTERILTTHTGSLPRPEDLTRTMFAKEEGVPVDTAALAARIKAAVAEVVGKQVDAGIDVVDDGEYSKPSYATYVKDRLHGFLGKSEPLQYRDLVDFPGMARRVFGDPGRARRKTPACTEPVSLRDPEAARIDAANLQAAPARPRAREAFLTAASPGVISLFFKNEHYPTHEAYLFAIAEAMRHEYETVARAGFVLQIDCPDLGDGPAHGVPTSTSRASKRARRRVEALNHALAGIPEEQIRYHVCWGNYEGPHTYDVPLADIVDLVLAVRAGAYSVRRRQTRATPTSGRSGRRSSCPEGKILIPGVIDSTTNFVEHPDLVAQRIEQYARLVGRENVIAGTDCGFGTWVGQAAVDPDIVWAKLGALAEGARLASKELW